MMPRLRLLALFATAIVPLTGGIWWPVGTTIGIVVAFSVLATALLDLGISVRPHRIGVRREAPRVLSVGTMNPIRVLIHNESPRTVTLRVHDEPPGQCDFEHLPFEITIGGGKYVAGTWNLQPQHRGKFAWGAIQLNVLSRLRLWTLTARREQPDEALVYPDIRQVYRAELLARKNRLAEAGVRLTRLRGSGNEFDRLREYRRGDEFRSIDWKATARNDTLISREYVVERNQNVLFLIDCGRSMCNQVDGVSHFDRALNATVLLSYVALRQGDTVGILACSNKVERWIRPVRTRGGVESIIRHTYDLNPVYTASDYDFMADELRRRHRKRSLVVLLTHAIDDVHLDNIARAAKRIRSPHLVLCGFLRYQQLADRVQAMPTTDLDAFQIAAAAGLMATQQQMIDRLRATGLLVVESTPGELSADLISRYLDIKARHLL